MGHGRGTGSAVEVRPEVRPEVERSLPEVNPKFARSYTDLYVQASACGLTLYIYSAKFRGNYLELI